MERRTSARKSARPIVDSLLTQIDEKAPLNERIEWLSKLFLWIREDRGKSSDTHLRLIFAILERNPESKAKVAKSLRSIIRDINAFDLFVSTGIATNTSFLSELYDRIVSKILPKPPRFSDFAEVFHLLFPQTGDANWILEVSETNQQHIVELLHFSETPDEGAWNSIFSDMVEAVFALTREIQVHSFAPNIRRRIGVASLSRLGSYRLDEAARNVLQPHHLYADREAALLAFRDTINACRTDLQNAFKHLEEYGVSVAVVYQLERLQSQLRRIESLVDILCDRNTSYTKVCALFHDLAVLADERQSISAVFRENAALLSRKITENNAEIGDHYITRTKSEYIHLILIALGGGVLTCLTVFAKVNLEHVELNYFSKGLLISLVYALSFVMIQWCGFTLATKQPAMTGAALASSIKQLIDSKDYTKVIEEVIYLVRSQTAAIFGNVMAVAPLMILIGVSYRYAFSHDIIDRKYAEHVLKVHSVLGLTPMFAAFTGVLLWLSSLCAGWISNWFILRELPSALAESPRLKAVLGWQRARDLANYLRRSIANYGGNTSLGFLLGMTPKLAAFFGILIDVRHVTLSTGTVALSAAVLGEGVLRDQALYLAIGGLIVAGLLNVSVSFGLALWVAGRAQRLRPSQSRVLYRQIVTSFLRQPWRFLLPVGSVKRAPLT